MHKIAELTLSSLHASLENYRNSFAVALLLVGTSGCAIFATRPQQEMSDTTAALRSAKEVQADVLAPELYREAQEWYFKAKQEYKLKNFLEAREYLAKSQKYAEDAEFEAVQGGANRVAAPPDPMQNDPSLRPRTPPEAPSPGRDAGYEDKNKPIYTDPGASGSSGGKSGSPKSE